MLLFPFLSLKDIAEDVIVKPDPSDAGGLADLYNAVMNLESGSVDPKENGSLKDEVLGLVVRVNPVADELMKALAERQSGFRRRHRRTVSEE